MSHYQIRKEFVPDCSPFNATIATTNPRILYRFQAGQQIEKSEDEGQSWETIYNLVETRQGVRTYYHNRYDEGRISGRNVEYSPGPFHAIVDVETKNLVFAMGWDGVLIHTPDGGWHWAEVAKRYHLDNLHRVDEIPSILLGEILLTLTLIPLTIATSSTINNRHRNDQIGVAVAWLLWLTTILIPFLTQIITDLRILRPGVVISYPLSSLIALGVALDMIWNTYRKIRYGILAHIILSMCTALLFFIPYVLWSQGTVPNYNTALLFSFALFMMYPRNRTVK